MKIEQTNSENIDVNLLYTIPHRRVYQPPHKRTEADQKVHEIVNTLFKKKEA